MGVVEKWTLWRGRDVIRQIFLWEVQHVYCAKFMLAISHNGNSIIYNIYRQNLHRKNMNNVLSQNVNVTKKGSQHSL